MKDGLWTTELILIAIAVALMFAIGPYLWN